MLSFADRMLARAITAATGTLPGRGETNRLPPTPRKYVRVIHASFYVNDRVPAVGEVIHVPADTAQDLVARGLAEYVL